MGSRDSVAIFLDIVICAIVAIMILTLVLLLLGCAPEESGTGTCHELWADCPGVAQDYKVNDSVSDVRQRVVSGERFFSYYNCSLGKRTSTIVIYAECELVSNDPR